MTAKYSKDDIVIRLSVMLFNAKTRPPAWNQLRSYKITEVCSKRHKIYMITTVAKRTENYYEDQVSEYIIRNKADYEQYCLEWEHRHLMFLLKQA